MIETILAIAEDQRVIAGLAVLVFSIFCLGLYIFHKERMDRIKIDPTEDGGQYL